MPDIEPNIPALTGGLESDGFSAGLSARRGCERRAASRTNLGGANCICPPGGLSQRAIMLLWIHPKKSSWFGQQQTARRNGVRRFVSLDWENWLRLSSVPPPRPAFGDRPPPVMVGIPGSKSGTSAARRSTVSVRRFHSRVSGVGRDGGGGLASAMPGLGRQARHGSRGRPPQAGHHVQ